MQLTNYYRNRTVLVTGGAGAIGSNLVRALLRAEVREVVVLDDLSSGFAWLLPNSPRCRHLKGCLTEPANLSLGFAARPSLVFHLAAFFANQNSVDHPEKDLQVNGLGTLRLLQGAQEAGVERVVYASSGCSLVSATTPLPCREEVEGFHLRTPYQITKFLGELYGRYFWEQLGLGVVRVRMFNSYGPGEVPGRYRNVIPNMFFWALRGQPLPVNENPAASRDFTFVEDAVDGLMRAGAAAGAAGREYNIASGMETRIQELALKINELTGNRAGIIGRQPRTWEQERLWADTRRAQDELGYVPKVKLEEGLERTLSWFREHWSQIERHARFATVLQDSPEGSESASR